MKFRPDLSRQITITPQVEAAYNNIQDNSKRKNTSTIIALASAMAVFTFLFQNAFPVPFLFRIPVALLIAGIGFTWFKKKRKGTYSAEEAEKDYLENCLKPLMEQIDPGVQAYNHLTYFPLYKKNFGPGRHSNNPSYHIAVTFHLQNPPETQGSQDIPMVSNEILGTFLYNNYVIPGYGSDFKTGFVIDTLCNNEDGFLFTNATAETTCSDEDGHHTITEFQGPLVAMKLSHPIRSGVGIYTTRPMKGTGKELTLGYRKVNTIDTENEIFNQNFEVTAQDPSQAFYVLSPLTMERLLALREKYGKFGLFLDKDYFIFAVDMRYELMSTQRVNIQWVAKEMKDLLTMVYLFKDAVDIQ